MLEPGTLWQAVLEATRHGLECGALQPIRTQRRYLEDGGVQFVVRQVANLVRKDRDRRERESRPESERPNPFLPYDRDLFVADVSDTHVALLNKFNVMEHHLLVVTRRFEDQDTPLTPADFTALRACLEQVDGLGFYNGGTVGGASQRHKHLQLVPLPLAPRGPAIPIEALLPAELEPGHITRANRLPFEHALAGHERGMNGGQAVELYRRLLAAAGVAESAPYNLLMTRTWMLAVPRRREHHGTVSINALGFAGSLFVRDDEELAAVERVGPMTVLAEVTR